MKVELNSNMFRVCQFSLEYASDFDPTVFFSDETDMYGDDIWDEFDKDTFRGLLTKQAELLMKKSVVPLLAPLRVSNIKCHSPMPPKTYNSGAFESYSIDVYSTSTVWNAFLRWMAFNEQDSGDAYQRLDDYLKREHSSYDGYISFVRTDAGEFLNDDSERHIGVALEYFLEAENELTFGQISEAYLTLCIQNISFQQCLTKKGRSLIKQYG